MILHLRGLVGEWEDGEAIFLGAIPQDTYDAICGADADEDTSRWEQAKQEWIDSGPAGIGETREIEIRLQVPGDLFTPPTALARSGPVDAGERQ